MGKRMQLEGEGDLREEPADQQADGDSLQEAVEDLRTWAYRTGETTLGELAERAWRTVRRLISGNVGSAAVLAVVVAQGIAITVLLRTPASAPPPANYGAAPKIAESPDGQSEQAAKGQPAVPSRTNPFLPLKGVTIDSRHPPEGNEVAGIPGAVLQVPKEIPPAVSGPSRVQESGTTFAQSTPAVESRLKQQIHLKGTIRYGNKSVAVFQDGARTVRVREGEVLPGFDARLAEVGARHIVLELRDGDRTRSIQIEVGQ